jgi:hypothetical protein
MLKFIANLFRGKKADAQPKAPYKVETPATESAPVVNSVKPVVNARKAPAPKAKAPSATGNTPAKKPVSSRAKKTTQPKK